MNAPDLELRRTWSVADISLKLQTLSSKGSTAEKQLDLLKDLVSIEREEDAPSIPAVATLVFLFLLVNIYGTEFE